MFPKRFAPALFGLILSGLMSLLVAGISTWRAVGLGDSFAGLWISAWLTAWLVAFPVGAGRRAARAPSRVAARVAESLTQRREPHR